MQGLSQQDLGLRVTAPPTAEVSAGWSGYPGLRHGSDPASRCARAGNLLRAFDVTLA